MVGAVVTDDFTVLVDDVSTLPIGAGSAFSKDDVT
jgi:hypothetical protein